MPTLVMMHGMTGTSEMMRPFAEKFYRRDGIYWFHKQNSFTPYEVIHGGDMKAEIIPEEEFYLLKNYRMLILLC